MTRQLLNTEKYNQENKKCIHNVQTLERPSSVWMTAYSKVTQMKPESISQ